MFSLYVYMSVWMTRPEYCYPPVSWADLPGDSTSVNHPRPTVHAPSEPAGSHNRVLAATAGREGGVY